MWRLRDKFLWYLGTKSCELPGKETLLAAVPSLRQAGTPLSDGVALLHIHMKGPPPRLSLLRLQV